MTTFQAVIYAISHAVSEFFPIGSSAHHSLLAYLIGWQPPGEALKSALNLGSFLALLIYFRHDWASMISCLLQVIIFRKKPMTLDERLPIFITLSVIPIGLTSSYFQEKVLEFPWTPFSIAIAFSITGFALWFFDQYGRKNKGIFDWNWIDALVIGALLSFAIIPGFDPLSSVLLGALFLNYKREPAVKFAYFALAPILMFQMISNMKEVHFHAPAPAPDLSWLSYGVAAAVTLLVGLLTIGGFLKHIQSKSLTQYMAYRWVLAAGVCIVYWFTK